MDFWRPGDSIKSHGFGEENLYIYQMVCVSVELDNPGGGGHGRFLIHHFFSIPPSMTMTKCHTSSIPPPPSPYILLRFALSRVAKAIRIRKYIG